MSNVIAHRTAAQYYGLLASSCRPSVRPSLCLSVTLCIVALRVGETVLLAESSYLSVQTLLL